MLCTKSVWVLMQQVQTPGATSPSCGQDGLKCCSCHSSVSLLGQGHNKGEVNKTAALLPHMSCNFVYFLFIVFLPFYYKWVRFEQWHSTQCFRKVFSLKFVFIFSFSCLFTWISEEKSNIWIFIYGWKFLECFCLFKSSVSFLKVVQ